VRIRIRSALSSRWPWFVACTFLGLGAAFFSVRAALKLVALDSGENTLYTSWVARPTAVGWGLAALLLFLGALLTAVFLRAKYRVVGVIVAASLAAGCAVTGLVHSHTRRDIAPRLVLAVETTRVPADATPLGQVRLSREGGFAYIGLLSVPMATREWQYPDTTQSGTCAALERDFAGSMWKLQVDRFASPGDCELIAREGYVTLTLDTVPTDVVNGQNYFVELSARPAGVF
jgi:hypothetical protein